MQDWSRVNGGHYTHLLSEGEMEIAFDRASTMLRRPAGYTLKVSSTFREAPGPGTLEVVSADGGTSAGGAVELILDASGSMLKRLDGKRRIVIAKEVLSEAVNQHIPPGTPVALRVFGHKEPNSCRTDLEMALAPLDAAAATKTIQSVNAMNLAKTPIADSLAKVESDLKKATAELEEKIEQLYVDGGIYKNVSVNVTMTAKVYYVQGEVIQPGQFQLMSGTTLLQAIAGARGYTAFANKKKVTITRYGKVYTYNVKDLERDPSKDVKIEAGDVIKVWQQWY